MAIENGKIINSNKIKTYIPKKFPLLSGVGPGNCFFISLGGRGERGGGFF